MMKEKSRPFQTKTYFCPIYGAEVYLTVGDRKKMDKWADKKGLFVSEKPIVSDGFCRAYEQRMKDGKLYTFYHVHLDFFGEISTLIHELVHLVRNIFVDYGIPFNHKNDETIAYYQGYWFERMLPDVKLKAVAKKRKVRRKRLSGEGTKS